MSATRVPAKEPLTNVLADIRQSHHLSQKEVEILMEVPEGTIRHIEAGRRSPPDFSHGRVAWARKFMRCVQATKEEEIRVHDVLTREILQQFSKWVAEIQDTDGHTDD
jgi:transcriptional regulator with XRE-family HTH domain